MIKSMALVLAVLVGGGCACRNQIPDDPKFLAVRDHLFVTKQAMQLHGTGGPAGAMTLSAAGTVATESREGAVLPSGTLIRPVQLDGDSCQPGGAVVTVRIESGTFTGERAAVRSDALFLNPYPADRANQPTPVAQWEPNPVFLEPARQ